MPHSCDAETNPGVDEGGRSQQRRSQESSAGLFFFLKKISMKLISHLNQSVYIIAEVPVAHKTAKLDDRQLSNAAVHLDGWNLGSAV